ncbi:MAG: lysylphosphatidylglycerol synthetase [Pseudozobellia sp.]|nr:lysylphosphatidylglycerol synthetase [Pseudozobellia sp.]
MANLRKKSITALKIAFSVLLIYLVFTKVEIAEDWAVIKSANVFYLILALLFFIISKIVAAFRLNLYFRLLKIPLSHKSNLQLYLLGMFYNLFLPGGIGGDAYKGYLIKKTFDIKTKKVVSVLLLDRLSGLLLLFIYACILVLFIKSDFLDTYRWGSIPLIILSTVVFYFLNLKFFPYVLKAFWPSFIYSSVVQLMQLICVLLILIAMDASIGSIGYLFVFLVSSIVAVLPLTIGGIGSREITFYYFSNWLGLNEDLSITLSMVFFLITAFTSFWGIIYHFKKPNLVKNQ